MDANEDWSFALMPCLGHENIGADLMVPNGLVWGLEDVEAVEFGVGWDGHDCAVRKKIKAVVNGMEQETLFNVEPRESRHESRCNQMRASVLVPALASTSASASVSARN